MNFKRRDFLEYCLATGLFISYPSIGFAMTGLSEAELQDRINRIGNSNDDKERVRLLQDFLNRDISEEEKEIVEGILDVVDRWANGFEKYAKPGSEGNENEGYLCGFFFRDCRINRYLLPQVAEDNKFFPVIAFFRARMLIAQLIQSGNISNVPEVRDIYLKESRRLMEIASEAFPENELVKNYLGIYRPWEEIVSYHPEAPAWANYQRMVLEKLTWMIHWWIDNRQISDGQFGGGWGDDVEMWRSWVPVLFAFNDEKVKTSKEKLFEGLFALSRMQKGYTTIMTDVEHTSEEFRDPLTCMLNLQPENPVWEQRALKVMDYIENLWTGVNERGQLQFKSTWFNAEQVHPNEHYACDTPYHTRLIEPLMLLWLRTGNQRLANFLPNWLKTWVEATFTKACGKPAGIIPAAIHWPDGKPAGLGEKWWEPENHSEPTLYYFPTQQEYMYECFLQAYHITKDEFYLKPVRFVLEKRLQGIGNGNAEDYTAGSLEWSISKLKSSIPRILLKFRLITGDIKYDTIFSKDAKGYERFIFDQDYHKLASEMDKQRKHFSLPKEFYTTEVRWTDRLFRFARYFNYYLEEPLPEFNPGFLFSCLTGNVGNYQILPVFGVKWKTPSTDIAILTEQNSTKNFQAQLFHFGRQPRKMKVKFLNLMNGTYHWQLADGKSNVAVLNNDNREIEFSLPSQKLCKFSIEKYS